jgi:hypothetical protein
MSLMGVPWTLFSWVDPSLVKATVQSQPVNFAVFIQKEMPGNEAVETPLPLK